MPFAVRPPMEFARIGQNVLGIQRGRRISQVVATEQFFGDDGEADTLNAARGTGETTIDHFVAQTHSLKNLPALV